MLVYPKEIFIATLRDFFSKDDYYHYSKDQWGYANTTDHTDLLPGADLPTQFNSDGANQEGLSTRVFIGEKYRYDTIFYPAILVQNGGTRYIPISINREQDSVQYEDIIFEDGYGNQTLVHKPKSFITAGIWEGSISIDILSRSLRARDDLVELVGICFTDIVFDTLEDIGIVVKPVSISAPTETDDRGVDKLFKQTLTFDIRTEWRREIPIKTLIDTILFTVEFQNLESPISVPAPNLTINTDVSITEMLLDI